MADLFRRKQPGDAWETAVVSSGGGGETAREQISGNNVSVANNAFGALTWDTVVSGDALLNLSVPAAPTVVEAGVYAVSMEVGGTNLTADGYFTLSLELDSDVEDAIVSTGSRLSTAAANDPNVSISLTYYVPAGGKIIAGVFNNDGAATRNFSLFLAVVQRIS